MADIHTYSLTYRLHLDTEKWSEVLTYVILSFPASSDARGAIACLQAPPKEALEKLLRAA